MPRPVTAATGPWTYVLEGDRKLPQDQQARFVLRPLTQLERCRVHDSLVFTHFDADGTRQIRRRQREIEFSLAVSHIDSVENFPIGAPRPWPTDQALRPAYLAQLSDDDVTELGGEIWTKSLLDVGPGSALGNSSAPALTSSSGAASEA